MAGVSGIVQARLTKMNRSQADVARALEVSTSTISRWISGETRPSQAHWDKLTEFLDLSEELPHPPAGMRSGGLNDVSEVIEAVRFARQRVTEIDLDKIDRRSVLIQVEDLLAQLTKGPMETLELDPEID